LGHQYQRLYCLKWSYSSKHFKHNKERFERKLTWEEEIDDVPTSIEQSMAVSIGKGLVLIVGCFHPYRGHILDAAKKFGKIYGIIGGMHGFSELFKDLKLICPTHCTQYKERIKKLYPDKFIEGGAGREIRI